MLSIVLESGAWHNAFMSYDPQPNDTQKIEVIRARLNRPVALIGMMGAGKTRLGKILSERLHLPFVDSDEEIEKAAGLSIPEIFEKFGEPYFRDGERRVIKRLIEEGGHIISTGGGAVMNPDTAQELWHDAIAIWVKADIDVILERTSRNDKRPLLKNGNPRETLTRLMEIRYPIYQHAHITVQSCNGPGDEVVHQAINGLYEFLTKEDA